MKELEQIKEQTPGVVEKKELKSEKMRNVSIGKLLISMSLPAMLSMLVQALYNVIDTIYVGMYYSRISEEAYIASTQALSVAFPMQMMILSVGLGIGVGANAMISKRLGEKESEEASQIAKIAVFLGLIASVLMSLIGIFLSSPFVEAISDVSGDNSLVIEYGKQYLTICASICSAQIIELIGTRILQSTGNMKVPMIAQIVGAGTNIILDPILIFSFDLGVRGAAIATVFSQFCAMFVTYFALIFKKQDVNISLKNIQITAKRIHGIVNVGLPALVLNAVGAITYLCLLVTIKSYALGGIVQQVLGLYFKLNSIIFMPVFGLMQGLLPILGFSYGAKSKDRFVSCLKLSCLLSVCFLLFGVVIFEVFPEFLLGLFSAGALTIAEGVPALRIIAVCFPFAALGINTINAFQSIQCGIKSLLMTIVRQVGIIIPFAIIFARFGSWGIWAAYPVAEFVSLVIFEPFLFKDISRKFSQQKKF